MNPKDAMVNIEAALEQSTHPVTLTNEDRERLWPILSELAMASEMIGFERGREALAQDLRDLIGAQPRTGKE
jgi:hypothetical protein